MEVILERKCFIPFLMRAIFASAFLGAFIGLVSLGITGRGLAGFAARFIIEGLLYGLPIDAIVADTHQNVSNWYTYPVIDPFLALLIATMCILTLVFSPAAWIWYEVRRGRILRSGTNE